MNTNPTNSQQPQSIYKPMKLAVAVGCLLGWHDTPELLHSGVSQVLVQFVILLNQVAKDAELIPDSGRDVNFFNITFNF
jgi:hypothetical protein